MNTGQLTVTLVLSAMAALLYSRKLQPPVIFISAAAVLVFAGIITPAQSMSGFANESIAVMILLIVMSQVIWRTGFVQWIFQKGLKPSSRYRRFLCQLMPFVGGSSAFMNNTPVVAMMIPFVSDWGKRNSTPASRLLMPLSWAAILGGMLTLIGTSTNMIVNSLVIQQGGEGLSILDFTPVGAIVFVAGMSYILLIGYRTFPTRKNPYDRLDEKPRQYISDLVVVKGSPLAGKTIAQAKLRSLKDLFLIEIIRGERVIAPVAPGMTLMEGDRLLLAGKTSSVTDIVENRQGLAIGGKVTIPNAEKLHVVEVVVSNRSSLTGRKVKETDFRGRFDAAILGVHRMGRRLKGKIGNMQLESGDLLLLVAGNDFHSAAGNSEDFYVISRLRQIHNIELGKSIFITGSVLLCIILGITGLVPLFTSLIGALALFLVFRVISPAELKGMVNLNILTVAAFALAIGKAVETTGLGNLLADQVIAVFRPLGPAGVLAAVYLTTNILAEFITTAAAATIVFPFAAASAVLLGADPTPYYLAVAYGAAANFITPVGYQTNLMIYGPGGYTTTDFLKAGFPMKVICAVAVIAGLVVVYL